jgi:hypothetical protein
VSLRDARRYFFNSCSRLYSLRIEPFSLPDSAVFAPTTFSLPASRRREVQCGRCAASICFAALLALVACTEATSWQKLLTGKITDQYPQYRMQPAADGSVVVHRPGVPDVAVDIADIARFCQRGPNDCNYATDKMLMELAAPTN